MRRHLWIAALLFGVIAPGARANTITLTTPLVSTTSGGPVDASAAFTIGAGAITITLTNLEANPTSIAQLISGLDFTLSTGATTGTLASSSGQQITVNGGGTFVLGSTVATGWGLNGNVSGGLQLDALGFIGPKGLILGPPGGSTYSNANGSIAGNGPHNPFLNQTATFVVDVTGVTASTSITGATFLFGTTAGANIVKAPEPSTISLLLIGFGFLVVMRKRIVPSFQ